LHDEAPLPTARVQRTLRAAPPEAYDAWLEEAALRDFICPAPGYAAEVALDPRVGGRFRLLMAYPDGVTEVTGEFLVLDRPERICLTWRSSGTGDLASIVTVTFAAAGEGSTLMTIVHSGLPANMFSAAPDSR
jgi:uncharacterized protein YndB with AHSA1/START domain